jgi:hypothetical protein
VITFAPFPIPVITPEGDGYLIFVEGEVGMWENMGVCVALCNGGQWRHFNTGQIQSHQNLTYGITKPIKPNLADILNTKKSE